MGETSNEYDFAAQHRCNLEIEAMRFIGQAAVCGQDPHHVAKQLRAAIDVLLGQDKPEEVEAS